MGKMAEEIKITLVGDGKVNADFGTYMIPTDHPPIDELNVRPPTPWSMFIASIGT